MNRSSIVAEALTYISNVRLFSSWDWICYLAWVGLMMGLFLVTGGFVLLGYLYQAPFPSYVWNLPVGVLIFVLAIAFDTIGHRSVYKAELAKGEALVHHITIFAGITSCLVLCLAYTWPVALRLPALVLIVLSIFYSVVDEALHWRRYLHGHSDRVEMWSHFFIFVGHLLMVLSWWQWFDEGYPGVAETLEALMARGALSY